MPRRLWMEKRKIIYPDYNNSLVNLAISILKIWNPNHTGQSLKILDNYLIRDYKNIVLILLDGMGTNIMEKNLEEDGFLRRHFLESYCSVFPSTTVSATTSLLSGLTPAEHAWLGWINYYPQIDKNVTVYLNTIQNTFRQAADYNVAWRYCPYESIASAIKSSGGFSYTLAPFEEPYLSSFEEICKGISQLCSLPNKKYIYAYWYEPDSTMHANGCYEEKTKLVLKRLELEIEKLSQEIEDTLLIVTSDHGQLDSTCVTIADFPEIYNCLKRMPTIEPRAVNFFVLDDLKEEFRYEFEREFGEKFILLTKDEVIKGKLFGPGIEHPVFRDMLGDYLAIAIDDLSICNSSEQAENFIGMHGGMTEDEMKIPLIIKEIPK